VNFTNFTPGACLQQSEEVFVACTTDRPAATFCCCGYVAAVAAAIRRAPDAKMHPMCSNNTSVLVFTENDGQCCCISASAECG
jgi:hypothetical protein